MSTEIVRYQSLQDMESIARTFALSGYFDAKGNQPVEIAKALTKILAGAEHGFGPYASIKGIYIIQGQTAMSGNLIATAIKRSKKYDYRVREKTATVCRIEFFQRSGDTWESLGIEVFTDKDAKQAGTKNMDKFPANMLFNRCITNGYRAHCPDVFDGGSVYTPDELGATVDEDGEYVESTGRIVNGKTGEITERPQPQDIDLGMGDDAKAGRTLLGTMHGIGRQLYGDTWDDKRHELARKLSKGRTASSEELTNAEVMKMVEGMGDKLRKATEAQKPLVEVSAGNGYA